MLGILKLNDKYNDNLRKYDKKDGLLALVIFLIIIILYSVLGILNNRIDFIHKNIMLVGCIFNFLMVTITILFVKKNNQRLDTIGLTKGKWVTSSIIGIILGAFYFYNNYMSNLTKGTQLPSVNNIIFLTIYYMLVALCEEVVFRGYIGTRINGIVKNRYISILVTGILFVIMHFPYKMIVYNISLYDLTIKNVDWIINLFFFHIVTNFIYSRTNSLYGSIIPHWLSNLGSEILIK